MHSKCNTGEHTGFNTGSGEKVSSSQARQHARLLLSFSPFPVLNPASSPWTFLFEAIPRKTSCSLRVQSQKCLSKNVPCWRRRILVYRSSCSFKVNKNPSLECIWFSWTLSVAPTDQPSHQEIVLFRTILVPLHSYIYRSLFLFLLWHCDQFPKTELQL